MKGAWRAIREGRLCTNDTREREEKKKQEARSLAQLIINAKMMFLIMNRPPKRWCFLIPSGGKEGEKKGLIYALDGPSFFFLFKPKTCYSNRGQMLIDDLLRTKKEEESLRRRTQKFIVLVWFLVKSPGEETICPPPQNMVVVMLVYIFIEQQLLLEDLKRKHWPTIQSDSIFSQRTQDKQDRFSSLLGIPEPAKKGYNTKFATFYCQSNLTRLKILLRSKTAIRNEWT